ncbi:hypothetical protein PENTCL1PPCAC_11926, partial [Pristionchus entomophagus]
NSSAVRGSSLNVAYGVWNYPYLYPQYNSHAGFLAEIWKAFDYDVVYHQYPFFLESGSESCDGVLQSVQDGATITSAGGSSPSIRRSQLFRMSLPVYYTAFQFFESSNSGELDSTEFTFFSVFSVPTLLLIIAAFACTSAVNYITVKLRE